ncbi:MAG TPA: phosphoribosyltransferase family protein [Candidatus Paceibacterota bacterium]|nr:phosphoribosyltransferase family protein [Candidatus Paceibacterota bacterium]
MKMYSYLKKFENFVLEIIFPTKCIGCDTKNEILCNNCVFKIRLAERETDKSILAVFDYRDLIIKRAIWELKYHHKRYLGEKLGQLLYEFLIEDIADIKTYVTGRAIYVIPVPISNKRTKFRGYNQANAIAKGFCDGADRGTFELQNNIVYKKRDTLPQAKITNRKRRLENVRDVFGIKDSDVVKGRTIIVVDDVTTTGGTINEIMKILKKAGAKKVIGFAVAH